MLAVPHQVEPGHFAQVRTNVLSRPLDALVRLDHPRSGLLLALHPDLVLVRASEKGTEVSYLLVHLPPIIVVGAWLPISFCSGVANLLG
jgi:hypothetical protein